MNRNAFLLVPVLALAIPPAASGQSVDTSEWVCEFCPFADGHKADYVVGATGVSEDSAYFGDASGYDEDGGYGNLDGEGSYADDDFRLQWYAEDLALDSRVLELDSSKAGRYEIGVAYRELPRREFNTTETVFESSGGDTLLLPSGWVAAGNTSGLAALNSNLAPETIESDRSVLDVAVGYRPGERWRLSADYRRQARDGLNIFGGSTFTNASLLPMPFDYVTDEVDLAVRFGTGDGFVSLGWYLSDFDNSNSSLTWDNPFAADPLAGNAMLAAAQAPDNRFQQLSVQAGYSWPAQKTAVSLSAAMGEIEQDEAFLPYTINSLLSADALPRSSLDGQVDTSHYALAVTSRAFDKLSLKFTYRYDERDNKTTRAMWNRVIVDSFVSGETEENVPYSFERSKLSASADYDLHDTLRLSAGYERKDIDRDFQEVAEQTEDTGWGRARWRPTPALELEVRGGGSRRDINDYNEVFAATLGQNPLLRKYNLAYRYREFGELAVAFSPPAAPVSVSLSALFADDSYTRSELGILSGDEFRIVADLGWTVSENATLYANVGVEDIESLQAGSESFGAPDWRATHDDDFTTIGAGFRVRNIAEKFDLSMDYTRSDGGTEIIVDSASGGPSEFPELTSELDYLRLKLVYQRSERLEINMNLIYQRFVADDWALEGVRPATIPNVLGLAAAPYSPEVILFGLGFRYRIGGASASE